MKSIKNSHSIYIEGLDLAGKSSCSSIIKNELGGEWLPRHLILGSHNPVKDLALEYRDQQHISKRTMAGLYIAALSLDIDTYDRQPTTHLMQDSLMISRSLAYLAIDKLPGQSQLKDLLNEMPPFENAFMLTASVEARLDRLRKREIQAPDTVTCNDLLVRKDAARFQAIESHLTDIAVTHFGATVIDTTDLHQKDVGLLCAAIIKKNELIPEEVEV